MTDYIYIYGARKRSFVVNASRPKVAVDEITLDYPTDILWDDGTQILWDDSSVIQWSNTTDGRPLTIDGVRKRSFVIQAHVIHE